MEEAGEEGKEKPEAEAEDRGVQKVKERAEARADKVRPEHS